jgi:hypothetical protein
MMSIEMAEKIAKFLTSNNIKNVNVMGGEFFCNSDWYEVMSPIADSVSGGIFRLVSNSDWVKSNETRKKLVEFIDKYKDRLVICLSKDRWHNNDNVQEAYDFLVGTGVYVRIATEEETRHESIVPVGRGELEGYGGFYSFMGCYCHNPENMYTFLIDEEGDIYKCSFGMIKYANIEDYIEGGFDARFKEYNTKFYGVPLLHCMSCVRTVDHVESTDKRRCQVKRE